jgi:MoaA/NifB/PqqE/SkfB family radical SAM enzyme
MLDHLVLLTTTRCNLRCLHCLRGYDQPAQDFPLDLLPRLLEDARLFGAHRTALTGGEPGLHPQFEALVGQIVAAGYTWHFVSNGLRTDLYLPVIERYRDSLTGIALSLDGASAATHNTLRNHPQAFERLLQAAQAYRACDIPLRMAVTLNHLNETEIPAMLTLAEELGATSINFAAVIPTAWNQEQVLEESERVELYLQIQELKENTPLAVRTLSSLYTAGGVHFCNNLALHEVTIDARGEMQFCCDLISDKQAIGSLREHTLPELLQMWLETSAHLQRQRVEDIARGSMPAGFDGCAYCNEFLK